MATSRRLDEDVVVLVLVVVLVVKEEGSVGIVVVFVPVSNNDGVTKDEALFQVVAREIKASRTTLLLEGRRSRTDAVRVCVSRGGGVVMVMVLNSN